MVFVARNEPSGLLDVLEAREPELLGFTEVASNAGLRADGACCNASSIALPLMTIASISGRLMILLGDCGTRIRFRSVH